MRKTEAILRAALAARRTGRAMYVYSLPGCGWQYASASWINSLRDPPDHLIEVLP